MTVGKKTLSNRIQKNRMHNDTVQHNDTAQQNDTVQHSDTLKMTRPIMTFREIKWQSE